MHGPFVVSDKQASSQAGVMYPYMVDVYTPDGDNSQGEQGSWGVGELERAIRSQNLEKAMPK